LEAPPFDQDTMVMVVVKVAGVDDGKLTISDS
jgi:hypothetical protein